MSTRLEDKTALVTGATSNIGRAIATAFAAEGAHVIVSGRSRQRGAEVVEEIHAAGGHAKFIAADLDGSAHASRGLAADATRALGGRIDVLVNNPSRTGGAAPATADEQSNWLRGADLVHCSTEVVRPGVDGPAAIGGAPDRGASRMQSTGRPASRARAQSRVTSRGVLLTAR